MPKTTEHLKPHQFKAGMTGNPQGRPALTPDEKRLRRITVKRYKRVITIALNGTIEELEAFTKRKDIPAIEAGVARALYRAIMKGDAATFERFAERLVGKIPDKLEVETHSTVNINKKITVHTDEELRARLDRIRQAVTGV